MFIFLAFLNLELLKTLLYSVRKERVSSGYRTHIFSQLPRDD